MPEVKQQPIECKLTLALGPPSPSSQYVQNRIFGSHLTPKQARGLDLLWQGCRSHKLELDKTAEGQQWGKVINSRVDAFRWLMERIADACDETTSSASSTPQ